MKIAFLSDGLYPYFKGGKEDRLFQITTRLSERGHDVHIYTMNWWQGEKVKVENGVTLHAISSLCPMYTRTGRRSITQALFFSLHVFPKILGEDFDVLEADSMPYFPVIPAWFVARLKGKNFFTVWHEFWGKYWFKYLGAAGIFGIVIEKVATMFSGKALVVSEMTSKRLPIKDKITISNGITVKDIEKIKPSKKKWDISYVGRLIKHKNVELLVKVANKKGYKTIIMGSGPELEYLCSIAKNNVQIVGFVEDSKDVFANIKSSKVFVNLSEREGFGISFIEALACGVPVVMSNHKDNAGRFWIDEGKTGYAIRLEENLVEEAIEKCMKKSMGQESKKSAKKYDWEAVVDRLEEVYNG
jgi:L-malate glycosyltransferase